ncbi:sugar transferase [Rhodovulum sp. DZ06]|uniref:sugar transferase n=1 Tax=Rhodovulum sp. DZ06 TaxID=3425126 RepID=UPI003D358DF8
MDIVLVLLAAPMVAPVILFLALLVRTDGGPAFYYQKRVGKDGKLFNLWKLRSMVVDADKALADYLDADPAAKAEWDRCQKLRRDPRITRWGGVLRKSSLDELPQLWNVLRGDMSLVGPRPFMPEQAEMYPGGAYYTMRPGLTCFWQTGDRNDSSFAARAIDDARYAREMSMGIDLVLIFRTFGVMMRQTGV